MVLSIGEWHCSSSSSWFDEDCVITCVSLNHRLEFREYAVCSMTSSNAHAVLQNKETKLVMVDGSTTLMDLFKAYRRRVKMERALTSVSWVVWDPSCCCSCAFLIKHWRMSFVHFIGKAETP